MPAICFTVDSLRAVKRALKTFFPQTSSSHLTEAIASAVGFASHAALLAGLREVAAPRVLGVSPDAFLDRMLTLGHSPDFEVDDLFESTEFARQANSGTTWPDPPSPSQLLEAIGKDEDFRSALRLLLDSGIKVPTYISYAAVCDAFSADDLSDIQRGTLAQWAVSRRQLVVDAWFPPTQGPAQIFLGHIGDARAGQAADDQESAWEIQHYEFNVRSSPLVLSLGTGSATSARLLMIAEQAIRKGKSVFHVYSGGYGVAQMNLARWARQAEGGGRVFGLDRYEVMPGGAPSEPLSDQHYQIVAGSAGVLAVVLNEKSKDQNLALLDRVIDRIASAISTSPNPQNSVVLFDCGIQYGQALGDTIADLSRRHVDVIVSAKDPRGTTMDVDRLILLDEAKSLLVREEKRKKLIS